MPAFFAISLETTQRLLAIPETGMGFQVVEERGTVGNLVSGEPDYWLILNARSAISLKERDDAASWLRSRSAWRGPEDVEAQPLKLPSPTLVMHRFHQGRGPCTTGIAEGALPTRSALIKEMLILPCMRVHRFSATDKNPRVDTRSGDFLPGTFATTDTDRPFAPSGFAAVGRFALPNVQPASCVYSITPEVGTRVLIGTVGPAYGQSGGGVEVFFPDGARNTATFKGPTPIPDE